MQFGSPNSRFTSDDKSNSIDEVPEEVSESAYYAEEGMS